jgi:hypothetical protein
VKRTPTFLFSRRKALRLFVAISLIVLPLLFIPASRQKQDVRQHAAGQVGSTVLSITLCPHGLGNCGDNVSINSGGNINPRHTTRNVTITITDALNQKTIQQGTVTYDPTSQTFKGDVDGGTLLNGYYQVSVKMQYFLTRQVPGIITITDGQMNSLSQIALVAGDMDDNNQLDISDYNILLSCFGSKQQAPGCLNPISSDVNDDGVVDGGDYNIFLREVSVQKGSDEPSPTIVTTQTPTITPTLTPTPTPIFPNRFFAPYYDTSKTYSLSQNATSVSKYSTLAFVLSNGTCQAVWNGVTPIGPGTILSNITSLRSIGGDAIVAFGGASGNELAQSCTNISSLQAQYQAVIDAYSFTHIDFDIEGAALADTTSIDRRNKAILGLENMARTNGKQLIVSYTLGAGLSGIGSRQLPVLQNAKSNGVQIDLVNIMTMDYGSANTQMGQTAINGANGALQQLQSLGINAKLGITAMIGQNDSNGEIFSLANAQEVLNYAKVTPAVQLLSFWSVSRDNGNCPGQTIASSTCSGIQQSPWQFSGIFQQFTQ